MTRGIGTVTGVEAAEVGTVLEMSHPWQLIRGVCLYRPASPDLMESVLATARKMEREWDSACAPLRSLMSERDALDQQIREMQSLLQSFSSEISGFRGRKRDRELDAMERIRRDCEQRCTELQARLERIEAEQEALTQQFGELHLQFERICVRYLMRATGDDRQACLHRLARLREELAEERARESRAGAGKRIRVTADAAFQAIVQVVSQRREERQMEEVWGRDEEMPRGGGWDCA